MVDTFLLSDDATSSDEDHGHNDAGELVVMFIAVSILFGCIIKSCGQKFSLFRALPYTAMVLFVGLIFGASDYRSELGLLGEAIGSMASIDPHLFLLVFLPGLIFESAFSVSFHIIKREFAQAFVLAGPGVVISMLLTALFVRYIFPYNWDWETSLLIGAILSATDPVAVVALLGEVGASKRLGTLIEAESLFNDGSAFVFFLIWRDFVAGIKRRSPGEVAEFLIRLSAGGVALGWGLGIATVVWIAHIYTMPHVETSITLAMAFLTFWLAESENLGVHVSGVLAVVTLGLTLSRYKSYISIGSEETLHAFWKMLGFLINTLIFFVSGIIVAIRLFGDSDHLAARDFGLLMLLYVFLHLIRAFTILCLSPILTRLGYGFNYKIGAVLTYGGLRGAVSLAMGLLVDLETDIPESIRDRILFHVAGIVLLTIAINGSTTGMLLKYLGLTDARAPERRAFRGALRKISKRSEETTIKLRSTEYSDADWEVVASMLPKYQQKARELVIAKRHLHGFDLTDEEYMRFGVANKHAGSYDHDCKCTTEELTNEIYHRLITAMQADFKKYHEEGMTNNEAITILDEAAATALDQRSVKELWKILKEYMCLPYYFTSVENCWLWAAQRILIKRKTLAVELALAFRHACDVATHQLDKFFPDWVSSDELVKIKAEVKQLRDEAESEWLGILKSYYHIWRALQTEKAARHILKQEEKEIHHLYHEGILQEREFIQMKKMIFQSQYSIQTHPLRAKVTKETHVMQEMCFWDYLDDNTKYKVKHARRVVYNQNDLVRDEKSSGLDIVLRGLLNVKDEKTGRTIKTLGISDTLGMWNICTGQPSFGVAYAISRPLIVAHLPMETCKQILGTAVGPYFWRLAGVCVLLHFYPEKVQKYSRFALESLCLQSKLVSTRKKKQQITLDWPTLILKGSAKHSATGARLDAKQLIDPDDPKFVCSLFEIIGNESKASKSSFKTKEESGSIEMQDLSENAEHIKQESKLKGHETRVIHANDYVFEEGSIFMILTGLYTYGEHPHQVYRQVASPDMQIRRCRSLSDERGDDQFKKLEAKALGSVNNLAPESPYTTTTTRPSGHSHSRDMRESREEKELPFPIAARRASL